MVEQRRPRVESNFDDVNEDANKSGMWCCGVGASVRRVVIMKSRCLATMASMADEAGWSWLRLGASSLAMCDDVSFPTEFKNLKQLGTRNS